MLVLSILPGQTVRIGDDIVVELRCTDLRTGKASLGVEAPRELRVTRGHIETPPKGQRQAQAMIRG